MDKFPAVNRVLNWLETAALVAWQVVRLVFTWLRVQVAMLWNWLKIRLPFAQALARRHLDNPATIIEDVAIFILALYFLFGVVGYFLVYQEKSESRFTETLSILYPLPAARVNDSFIWDHQYLERLRFLTTFSKQAPKTVTTRPPTDQELRGQLMVELAQEKVVFFEAQKQNISVSEAELQKAYAQQKSQTPNFEAKIKQLYGMTPGQFQDILAIQLLKSKVESAEIVTIHVRHILVTTPGAAAQAQAALKAGQSFADVAKQFSQDNQTKDKGGDLGVWTKGQLTNAIGPAFEISAFGLAVNAISGPVQTQFGYHIIQVTERTGKTYETFDDWFASVKKNYTLKTYIPI